MLKDGCLSRWSGYGPLCPSDISPAIDAVANLGQMVESIRPRVPTRIPLRSRFARSRPLSRRKGTIFVSLPYVPAWYCFRWNDEAFAAVSLSGRRDC